MLGGGIGGLCAAIGLRQVDVDVEVFEQANDLSEIGAGIQISPNAARVLHHLGLKDRLEKVAVLPTSLDSRDWESGQLLGTYEVNCEPLPFGAPHYLVHRADLQRVLLDALFPDALRFGQRCTGVRAQSDQVRVEFADGSSTTADMAVGADGIHSAVRQALFGQDRPAFSGAVAYRSVVPSEQVEYLDLPNTSTKWWGPVKEHHLVHYHIADGRLINVVGVVPENDWQLESWTAEGDPSDFAAAFANFHAPIPELVGAVTAVNKFAIFDRPPLEQWTVGRVTLLGDASHPMVPFMAQGAAMAIEDAAILARCLEGAALERVVDALHLYDSIRRERTDRMQLGSRADTSTSWNAREWVYSYDPYSVDLREPTGELGVALSSSEET